MTINCWGNKGKWPDRTLPGAVTGFWAPIAHSNAGQDAV